MPTLSCPDTIPWSDATRRSAFEHWLGRVADTHGLQASTLTIASADASFRRYLRLQRSGGHAIVMDAPPPLEDVRPFVQIARQIAAAGLHAPEVLEVDAEHGFLLLEDLGRLPYLDALLHDPGRGAEALMRDAAKALVHFQLGLDASTLPAFDEALIARELALFPEWCVQREFGVTWTAPQQQTWERICRLLIDSALGQPQVAVHRDWMPRNLMVCSPNNGANPGILDFQDAVRGPITYDLASMLRDAFISWDEERELDWAVRWWEQARRAGVPLGEHLGHDFGELWRALEWMGLQRHLKVLGIFCRLKHRDGKPRYAQDLPRFFGYATRVALRYAPLKPLLGLLEPLSGSQVSSGFTF